MNTDRELLELAAKAAGYTLCEWPGEGKLRAEVEPNWRPVWNPLTDDGDALRLAVRLRIDFCVSPDGRNACAWATFESDWIEEPLGADEMAATRRAIVRAAAALGRAT